MASNSYPLPNPVKAIGVPGQGTHGKAFNKKGGSDNWESENAVDLPAAKGTPVYAVADGTIGKKIGSLGSNSSRMAGLRLHLVTDGNEFYYAHLSRLVVKAGQVVHAGDLLGYSGVANGVGHLHLASKFGDPRSAFGSTSPSSTQTPSSGEPQQPDAIASATDLSVQSPQSPAPPTALGTPGPDVEMPGSVDYSISPHHVAASLWEQAAQGPLVSPETMAMVRNAQLATGA